MPVRTAKERRVKCSGFVALMVALLLALALPAAAGAGVDVWFLRNGKPVSVPRGGTTVRSAVEGLLAGPTILERGRGMTTAVPGSTPLRSVTVSQRVVTVDLGGRFAAGRDVGTLQERVGQLVRTLRGISGVRAVKVLVDGGTPVGLFPGYDLRRPITTPVGPAKPVQVTTRYVQQELVDLGFMDRSGLTGAVDMQTSTAVLGFQKWIGLPRDGSLGPAVVAALDRTARPEPKLRKPGRRIEVQLRRQLALL